MVDDYDAIVIGAGTGGGRPFLRGRYGARVRGGHGLRVLRRGQLCRGYPWPKHRYRM